MPRRDRTDRHAVASAHAPQLVRALREPGARDRFVIGHGASRRRPAQLTTAACNRYRLRPRSARIDYDDLVGGGPMHNGPGIGSDLGTQPSPGARHYRAFVGPPATYDLVAAMQFNLLTSLGLREHHALLDIGCGSLRAGLSLRRLLLKLRRPRE